MSAIAELSPEVIAEQYDATVRADIEAFRGQSQDYMAGRLTDDEFRGFRLRRGIYGQRQAGVHMVRTKVPGGILTARQMNQLARIADEFGSGRGHLTTRQNVQYHFVPLPDVPALLHLLADVRLTTREACYNTVRNVTACPTAGLLRDEVFNVNPYAQRVAFAFLHRELTDSMPRKFKIALCGCSKDCMVGAIHDAGLKAEIRDGKRGFRMVVGGGLGPLPNEAALLDEFVPEERIINKLEAVLRVFNKYGNRKNKNKARLKFVLRERGFEWLRDEVEKEYQDVLVNGGIPAPTSVPEGFGGFEENPQPVGSGSLLPIVDERRASDLDFDAWLETNVTEQRQTGYSLVTVRVDQGNLTGDQMRGLAKISTDAGDGLLRFTIDQNVLLGFIPVANLRRVHAALKPLGLSDAGAKEIDDITTCPGAWTCNLGLTKSMTLGAALSETVKSYRDPLVRKLQIKISGCPNSCGQHWISDFGFYGNARKIGGREVPYYLMMLGGGYDEGGMIKFGLAINSLPARLAPVAVQRVLDHFVANRNPGESFRNYVMRHKVESFKAMTSDLAKPAELFPEMYKDWGDDNDFSLQLGRGECAS
ncbi:MAG TPA: nitrite/sulfite reductase [Bryobacteraceae bacterium]|nr:nitrite/sulfite reductase [Bryobacteraceae bacterium]